MNRWDRAMNQQEAAERNAQRKRQAPMSANLPTYGENGNIIQHEVKERKSKKKLLIILSIILVVILIVYIPGLFMKEKQATDISVASNKNAIRLCNKALQNDPSGDFDDDGLINSDEEKYGTDPWNVDSDGDGAIDFYELNISKTDPTVFEDDILLDKQKEIDKSSEKKVNSPYRISNVYMWADNYTSKAFGSVVKTQKGYRFSNFKGYVQFPKDDGKYAYILTSEKRISLPYDKDQNVWRIDGDETIELYQKPLVKIAEIKLFGKSFYFHQNPFNKLVAAILPSKGWITGDIKTKNDIEPDTADSVTADIKSIKYDSSDTVRFTKNSNSLEDLQFVRKTISEKKSCVAVSLYNGNIGEYIGIIYGYTSDGNLMIADANTLQEIGELSITEHSKKIIDKNGDIKIMEYFGFDGLGYNSNNGDRICFFATSSGDNMQNEASTQNILTQANAASAANATRTTATVSLPEATTQVQESPDDAETISKEAESETDAPTDAFSQDIGNATDTP